MGILAKLFGSTAPVPEPQIIAPRAEAGFYSLTDPALLEFLRDGTMSKSGVAVSVEAAMKNPTVLRCVSILSQTMGMLPLHLLDKKTREPAKDHPLYRVLHRKPNKFQTAYEFRMLMQLRAVTKKNAYALIVRSPLDKRKILQLIPLDPDHVRPIHQDDWSMRYEYRPNGGQMRVYQQDDIFHLRGLSRDGINGLSMVEQAAEAIGLAMAADLAASRLFKNGAFVPGVLETSQRLGEVALTRLKAGWKELFSGADKAGETPILEQGLSYKSVSISAKDAQHAELRKHQIEEIARIFGIPRPLLMMDDTSWGSGIEVLGEMLVRFGLSPWFTAWEQLIETSLLSEADQDRYEVKFNDGALTRGSLKDQGEYFAKASGAGGHRPWMTPNEIRNLLNMPDHAAGDSLDNPMTTPAADPAAQIGHNGGPPLEEAA